MSRFGRRSARLERLERAAAVTTAQMAARQIAEEDDGSRFEEAWAIMRETMSQEHAAIVVDSFAQGMQYVLHPDWDLPAGTLLRRCLDALSRRRADWPHSLIEPEVALAMPPVVAEVYLQDPHALPLHECEDCGYKLPHQYFSVCPLCGGRVGWNAFYHKHKDSSGTI